MTISLQNPLPVLVRDFGIAGTGPAEITVQRAAGAAAFPIFQIAPDMTVGISLITITNGDARGSAWAVAAGWSTKAS
jgi:hypothetical protein